MTIRRACEVDTSSLYDIFMDTFRYSCSMGTRIPPWHGYAWAVIASAACTVGSLAMSGPFHMVNIAMLYLLVVVIIALTFSRGPAVTASVLCMLAFNFFFVPPRYTFAVEDPEYLLAFGIILAVGLIVARLTENVRRQAQRQAQLTVEAGNERMRSALLASISHDLRTPLAVLTGASSTLAEQGEKMDVGERRSLSESIHRQAIDLSDHVAKVLQMTRLETENITINRDWAAIPEIVDSALRRLSEQLQAHHVLMEIPNDLPLVRVDASLIEQAIVNLLENAARHTPAGTVIRVRALSSSSDVTLSVMDAGPGMSDENLDGAFAKFHHGTGPRTGVGLGLPICGAIVRLHGGQVWAERNPNGGMSFSISIATEPPPAPPTETESQ